MAGLAATAHDPPPLQGGVGRRRTPSTHTRCRDDCHWLLGECRATGGFREGSTPLGRLGMGDAGPRHPKPRVSSPHLDLLGCEGQLVERPAVGPQALVCSGKGRHGCCKSGLQARGGTLQLMSKWCKGSRAVQKPQGWLAHAAALHQAPFQLARWVGRRSAVGGSFHCICNWHYTGRTPGLCITAEAANCCPPVFAADRSRFACAPRAMADPEARAGDLLDRLQDCW